MCDNSACEKRCDGASLGAAKDIEDFVAASETHYSYAPMLQMGTNPVDTPYRKLEALSAHVTVREAFGRKFVEVAPEALAGLAKEAFHEIQHFFRPDHLNGWKRILEDPEATPNDKFVAASLLKNACIAAGGVLPSCQDTGTAIVFAKKGEGVWANGKDEEALGRGIWEAYTKDNLRYSQNAPLTMFKEANTSCNLPAQFDILAVPGNEYKFMFIAKGGGSANKSYLYQETKALLNPTSLRAFIEQKLRSLGTSACPPYHIALVIGGTSAELTMKMTKLASCRYLDSLPTTGDASGRAFRDLEWEQIVLDIANSNGIGSQFGGKYFAHQARVIRLPRHGASCPVGLGVSCSADRQILATINEDGVFIEQLDHDPAKYLPADFESKFLSTTDSVKIDLNRPMAEIRAELSKHAVKTRLSLSGTIVVARDIAHAKLKELIDSGKGLPQYVKDHCIYYAGPAKTPHDAVTGAALHASGSFGPTTAGRMDSYVGEFMSHGGSFITLAKGNRSKQVMDACKKHGGFYLGSIGGPAALLAQESIKTCKVLEFPELGMEAIWSIEVEDFPAFIVVDDKGNDFYDGLTI